MRALSSSHLYGLKVSAAGSWAWLLRGRISSTGGKQPLRGSLLTHQVSSSAYFHRNGSVEFPWMANLRHCWLCYNILHLDVGGIPGVLRL